MEELRDFYRDVVARDEVRRALVLRSLSPLSRGFHESGCATFGLFWILGSVWVIVTAQRVSYAHFWVIFLVPVGVGIGFYLLSQRLLRRSYSGPVIVLTGIVESVDRRSSSGGEYTVSVVAWREAHEVEWDGCCRTLPVPSKKATMVDLRASRGQTVRQVVVNGHPLADVTGVTLPESDLNPGELPIASPVPSTVAVGRTRFFEAAQRAFRTREFCALSLDLDDFEAFNAEHGTEAGDWMVAHAAREIRRGLGPGANVGHCGGDEFSVTLPVPLERAMALAERVRRMVASGWMAPGQITVSIGVAEATPGTPTLAELLKAADQALQTAKREGKNRVSA
jgi:diguanylate cyclase (GGDEF)-like protein